MTAVLRRGLFRYQVGDESLSILFGKVQCEIKVWFESNFSGPEEGTLKHMEGVRHDKIGQMVHIDNYEKYKEDPVLQVILMIM